MEKVRCNSCGSAHTSVVWKKITSWEHSGHFTVVQCRGCHLIYLNPRPTRSEMGQYYQDQSYWGVSSDQLLKQRNRSYAPLYRRITALAPAGRILDIGAGTGLFLSGLKERGWHTDGVEFSSQAAEYSKKHFGIRLKIGDFLDFSYPPDSYDVVTLNNALEHLPDPATTLRHIERILKPNGLLLITVPNAASLGWRIFGPGWYALQPPRHLYHFTPRTLSHILAQAGFAVQDINHWYWIHNYFAIFESFRLAFSPRFAKAQGGTISVPSSAPQKTPSLKKELGKFVFKSLAASLALLGSVSGRGETICVCAKKMS